MPYIGSQPTKVVSQQSSRVYRYTATAGQTVFSGADVDNQVLNVTPSDVEVHMNGLLLDATDYTVTSSSVTLGTAANAGDELTVTGMVTFEVADTYDKTTADARYVNASGDTMTGGLNVTGGNVGIGTTSPQSNGGATARVVHTHNSAVGDWAIDHWTTGSTGAAGGDGFIAGVIGSDAYLWNYEASSMIFATNSTESMRIDSAGRVTMPYQVGFFTRRSISGDGRSSGAQEWSVNGQGSYNQGNHFNTSNGRFTAPVGGKYYFAANVGYKQTGIDWNWYFDINGTHMAEPVRVISGLDSHSTFTGTMIVALNSGDYVQVYAGNTHHVNTTYNYFSGHLIG